MWKEFFVKFKISAQLNTCDINLSWNDKTQVNKTFQHTYYHFGFQRNVFLLESFLVRNSGNDSLFCEQIAGDRREIRRDTIVLVAFYVHSITGILFAQYIGRKKWTTSTNTPSDYRRCIPERRCFFCLYCHRVKIPSDYLIFPLYKFRCSLKTA